MNGSAAINAGDNTWLNEGDTGADFNADGDLSDTLMQDQSANSRITGTYVDIVAI